MNPKSHPITLNATMEQDDGSSCEIDLENMTPSGSGQSHQPPSSTSNRPPNSNLLSMVHHKWRKMLRRDSAEITPTDPSYKTVYLGNVVTTWAKGEGCLERPASALWKNHCQGRGSIKMLISVAPSGLKAQTREHGLTEYWANRLTWCGTPPDYPKLFCWIYRHEGRKLKQELRCHAVLCSKDAQANRLANSLKSRLTEALFDFKKEKILRQNARLSIVQSLYSNSATKRKLVLMNSNSQNYKPPLERSKSAPKLSCIEEFEEEDNFEEEEDLTDSRMTIPECEEGVTTLPTTLPHIRNNTISSSSPLIHRGDETENRSPLHLEEESPSNEEDDSTPTPSTIPTSSPIIISHRKSYPSTQPVTHHPDGSSLSRRPHTVPMDAKLNLPYMTGYDKVMHLLDMPGGDNAHQLLLDEDDDEFSFTGGNSDPVASSPGSDASESVVDSSCGGEDHESGRRRRSSCEGEGMLTREDEINDNVSDESGYSEEAVVVVNNNKVPSGSPVHNAKKSHHHHNHHQHHNNTKNLSSSTIIIMGGNHDTENHDHSHHHHSHHIISPRKPKTSTTTTFKSDDNGGTTATTLVVYDNLCFEI